MIAGFCRQVSVLALAVLAPVISVAELMPQSVLILDQSGADGAWFRVFYPAFQAALNEKATTQISVHTEHLDLNRFSGPRRDDVLRTFLRDKYSERPIGLIVAQGSGALEFLMRTSLWPDTPVVIAAVDDTTIARLKPPPNVTGATYRYTFRDAVASAKMLVPNLKKLALVGMPFELQSYNRHFKEELPVATAGLEIIDLLGLPMADVLKRVAALPEDTAIIYTGIDIDGAGVVYYPPEALKIIAQKANRPIAIGVSSWVGFGGTGGLITSASLVGADTADRVARRLEGDKPDIPIVKGSFVQPIFDWRELQRFGVDERNLPKDSEIRFRPPSYWDQYRWMAITTIAIFFTQALMISSLLIERRRRRFAEADAQRHLLELMHSNRTGAVSAMSTSIAHELGQPLGAIQSHAEAATLYLKKNPPALEKVEEILTNIRRDDQRAADIIDRVRALLKKKNVLIELQEFDFNEIARDTLEIARAAAKEREVEFDANLANCALRVRGDRVHLQQVILNLAM